MAKKHKKTNAMRHLDRLKIPYSVYTYDDSDNMIDGVTVANMIGLDVNMVYKTIVTRCKSEIFVFAIAVDKELDLKKCAAVFGKKSIELISISEINNITGYIKGGCSPIGMKKNYPTCFDIRAKELSKIVFNAGKVGMQIEFESSKIEQATEAVFADICL